MKRLFGTDGVRGEANIYPMNAEIALKMGMAAGSYFTRGEHRHIAVIGKDTRLSGYMFEQALTAGFLSVGMDVILVGPMPTPGVAMLTRSLRADLGVMISASHNPYHDNGIKFFNQDGNKLSDQVEMEIEELIFSSPKLAANRNIGRAKRLDDAAGRYIEFVKNTFPKGLNLNGLKIVIDAANGAGYHLAKKIFWELGAEVVEIGVKPDGFNINDNCGSVYPENLCVEVVKNQADIGVALDGDADRLIISDEKGKIIDGDQIMAVIATYWQKQGWLRSDNLVSTLMSNMAFEHYLNGININLIRTKIGDRYVAEAMREHNSNIGGEQSGHVILSDYNSTGDALIAALQIMAVIAESKEKISKSARLFDPFPQILKNIKIEGDNYLENSHIRDLISANEKKLSEMGGRLLVRKSGTEPLLRIMAEGQNHEQIEKIIEELAKKINILAGL